MVEHVRGARGPVKAVDVGTGDGIIAHQLLEQKKATYVLAIDSDPSCVQIAQQNLDAMITTQKVRVEKLRAQSLLKKRTLKNSFDVMVINPPFYSDGAGKPSSTKGDQKARHDSSLNLKDWAQVAGYLLKPQGELYFVFPTARMVEAISQLAENQIVVKQIWWHEGDKRKQRFFARAVKNGKMGLKIDFDY